MAVITTADALRRLVREYLTHDAFVFDLETVYTPTDEEAAKAASIRAIRKDDRTREQAQWLKVFDLKPTDPLVNEVIWIGLATDGRSDSIATGHPKGTLITPARKVDLPASEAYELDDPRRYTKGGKVSERKVSLHFPAEFGPPPQQLSIQEALQILRPLFFSNLRKSNQNLKFDIKTLVKYYDGEFMPGPYFDLANAMHIINENVFVKYSLENQVTQWLGHHYNKLGALGVQNFSFEEAAKYAEQDCRFTWLIDRKYRRILAKHPSLEELMRWEMVLYGVLMRKEYRGVDVDRSQIDALLPKYQAIADAAIEKLIVDYGARPDFNPNATLHKRELVYEKYKAPVLRKTGKTKQASTDAIALEAVRDAGGKAGEVAALLLEHADVDKLIGTYLVGLGVRLDANSRLHPDFYQYATDTGRLSAREPNVQNIPRESDMRHLFVAPPGYVLISVDYDQMELRFLCARSKDPGLQKVFLSGEDVHTATAAIVLGKDVADVTPNERQINGKTPNFLIGYGGGAYRLHLTTGIAEDEAQKVIDNYFTAFARINPWKAHVLRQAKARAEWADGELVTPPYVETMMGRRRRLPDLMIRPTGPKFQWKHMNRLLSRAERQAVNTVIQGSAAETTKLAMIDIDNYVERTGFPLQMVLNIHDEVVAIAPERHAEEGLAIMESLMQSVVNPRTGEPPLRGFVPLTAKGTVSDRWEKG
jgi:DNA polymerase I-like protein with 3'-5' exonuclease and polymerase domains